MLCCVVRCGASCLSPSLSKCFTPLCFSLSLCPRASVSLSLYLFLCVCPSLSHMQFIIINAMTNLNIRTTALFQGAASPFPDRTSYDTCQFAIWYVPFYFIMKSYFISKIPHNFASMVGHTESESTSIDLTNTPFEFLSTMMDTMTVRCTVLCHNN